MKILVIFIRWSMCLVAVAAMWHYAYRDGVKDGERGLGYWEGWQDAMTATQYGRVPYNSEKPL